MKTLEPIIDSYLYKNKKVFPAEIVYEITTQEDGLPFGIAIADIELSVPHFHKETYEIYIVVQGTMEVYLDGKPHKVSAGQEIRIPKKVVHYARSLGDDPARLVVICIPEWSQADYFEWNEPSSSPANVDLS